jgi:hypothetical protein
MIRVPLFALLLLLAGQPLMGQDTDSADPPAADSAGSFVVSAAGGTVGAMAGTLGAFFAPPPIGVGLVYGGGTFGAMAGDLVSGGVDPGLGGALIGTGLGTLVGIGLVTALCSHVEEGCVAGYAAFYISVGVGGSIGIQSARARR